MKKREQKRIMVMDDDRVMRDFAVAILKKEGYDVAAYKNGSEGIAAFALSPFDCIITDINMPVVDGIDVILAIRRENSDVPIIAMSGAERGESLLKMAEHLSADAVLNKPLTSEELTGAVRKALKN